MRSSRWSEGRTAFSKLRDDGIIEWGAKFNQILKAREDLVELRIGGAESGNPKHLVVWHGPKSEQKESGWGP